MIKKHRILGIIPARAGSKGVSDKNIRLLAGKPLIHYTIQTALLSDGLDRIVVSSDSERILDFCKNFPGIDIPFVRPTHLSGDTAPMIEVVQHAVHYYTSVGETFDYVCLLQPTSPFRNDRLIDKAIERLIEEKGDSLTTVRQVPSQYNPHWTFKMDDNLLSRSMSSKAIIPRRQELPDAWYRDGKIYLTSIALVKQGTLLGGKMIGLVNDHETSVNIDTWEDWNMAEKLLKNGII